MAPPRILLLTWCAPDSPYAGGEVLRRIVRQMPAGAVRWIGLAAPQHGAGLEGIDWRAVPARCLHWRLRNGELGHWWSAVRDIPRMAVLVEQEARAFQPQVLWVLGELAAVGVGLRVSERLGIPLHVTMHDAPEESRHSGVPKAYGCFYRRSVRRLLRSALSVDTVSAELLRHLIDRGWVSGNCRGLVLPPSVPASWMAAASADTPFLRGGDGSDAVRRIGMCGSLRVGRAQWQRFLRLLQDAPFETEIVAFGATDTLGTDLPPGITVRPQPYVASEETVITLLRSNVDACYLGLWRDPGRVLFARTSLSSKLVTYAAAGRPIIVDAPEDSVAWRLVRQYGAGILLKGDGAMMQEQVCEDNKEGPDRDKVMRLLRDTAVWRQMADGAALLGRAEFELDRSVERFKDALMGIAQHSNGLPNRAGLNESNRVSRRAQSPP